MSTSGRVKGRLLVAVSGLVLGHMINGSSHVCALGADSPVLLVGEIINSLLVDSSILGLLLETSQRWYLTLPLLPAINSGVILRQISREVIDLNVLMLTRSDIHVGGELWVDSWLLEGWRKMIGGQGQGSVASVVVGVVVRVRVSGAVWLPVFWCLWN